MTYQTITTFSEYLLVAQDAYHVTHHARQSNGSWTRQSVVNPDGSLLLDSVGCALAMRDIYEDVAISPS